MTADISTDLSSWSTTAASNQPDYSDSVGPNNLADNLRALQAAMRLVFSSGTIASAGTTNLSSVTNYVLSVSGTTTITALGTLPAGVWKILVFENVLTFTHHSTSLILPTGASITTAAEDVAIMLSLGSGNWRCISYMRKSGAPLTSVSTFGNGSVGSPSIAFTSDTDNGLYYIGTNNYGLSAGGAKVIDVSTSGVAVTGALSATTTVTATTTHESSVAGYRMASGAHSWSYATGNTSFTGDGGSSRDGLLFTMSSSAAALINTAGVFSQGAFFSGGGGFKAYATDPEVVLQKSSATPAAFISCTYTGFAGDTSRNAITLGNTGGAFFRVRSDGAVFADGAYSGSGADFAEYFLPAQGSNLVPGDTVALVGGMVKLAGPHDEVIGVVSDAPTVIGDMALAVEGGVPVGLVGKLWVKRGSPINPNWRLLEAGRTLDRYLVR